MPGRLFVLLLFVTALVVGSGTSPLAADDEAPAEALTISVEGKALDVAALRAREAEVRAALEKINEAPATDPEARKLVTEPRATLASALKDAADLMEQIAGAPATTTTLKAEIEGARGALAGLRERAAQEVTLDGAVDDERIRGLEAQGVKAAQDLTNASASLQKLEEDLKKRQADFDGLEARQAELKARADALLADLEKTAEDAVREREILAVQIATNQVRKGIADLRQAHHVILLQLDTERRDLAAVQVDVARTQQVIADATLARARAVRQTQLEEEARRREAEAARKLREAELEGSPSVKAIKRLDALVGRMETDRTQDRKRISELKALRDDGKSLAQTAATRVASIRLLYPEGAALEPWQREGLAEQVRQEEQDLAEFERFRAAQVPDLNALLAQVLTKSGRLEIFGDRLAAAQDRIERGDDDVARVAAIEREIQHSRDEDYSLWLQARLDFLRGQAELRPDEVARFRAEWEKNTSALKTLVRVRIEDLAEVRSTAEELRTALRDAAAALDARRDHLHGVTFWLREPSLFSAEHLDAARDEAVDLWERVPALPGHVGAALRAVRDGGEGVHRRLIALVVFLLLALGFGLRLRGRLRAASFLAQPVQGLGRWGRAKRILAHVYRAAWLPVLLLAAALYARVEILGDHSLGFGPVALGAAWFAWALARGLNRAFFTPDAEGRCVASCELRTARGARRVVRTTLVGSGLLLAALLLLRAAGAPRLARLDAFAWGSLALVVGVWLAIRRDVLTVFVPAGRGGLMARTLRGLLRLAWPLVVLVGGALLALDALGYRTAGAFYSARVLWCILAFLALGVLHAILRTFLRQRMAPLADEQGEDAADAPERMQLVARFLGGLLTAALLVGMVVTLSFVFDLGWADSGRIGAINLTGGEAGTGLTLGRLVRALLIFWVSLGLARYARDVVRAVLSARQVPQGSRYAVRTLLFYALVTVGTLAALSALGVELGQLGWLLTAASVGIGFGLQEIISNFISGLILFFERPVQVGDVVSLGDVQGDVQQINIRSTVVRTRDGVAIIIPNKRLITEDVVNWSHGEQRTRVGIAVGVAYGSDVELVKSILLQIAAAEDRILKRPPPEVDFLAFGESELQFRMLAWLATPDPTVRRRVMTAVNTRIDALFREHGVQIPFPQRDLHLRSSDIGSLGRPASEG